MEAGKYKVKRISDCFMGLSKEKKTPFYALTFELENGGSITHTEYLVSNEHSHKKMEQLLALGFIGSRLADLADEDMTVDMLFGKPDDDIYLTVELEAYEKNGEIKYTPKVKWINIGEGVNKIDKKTAMVVLKSMPFDGFLAVARKGRPAPKTQDLNSDDIPF